LKEGEIKEIIPSGIGIGLEQGDIFEEKLEELEISLKSNELYVFYSDGVTEAMNSNKEFFGEKRFNDLLKSSGNKSTSIIQSEILSNLKLFRGTAEQNDDITFVLVKIK
jgi:sigma-B regulation protein RsbU (phosphoserine phosphatase)